MKRALMLSLSLPLPSSLNQIWRVGRGHRHVHRSARYQAWLTGAGWELVLQQPKPIAGAVTVTIAANKPDRRRKDVDGLAKAVLELALKSWANHR